MGNSILYNTAGSIALAINYVLQGPYTDKFLTKQAAKTVRINAEFFCRVDDVVFCIESDVDLDEGDLDAGVNYDATDTYYIYACHPLDGTLTPVFKISKNATFPAGGWDASNSRKIGGFDTDGAADISEATLWDLRTVDIDGAATSNHDATHVKDGSDEINGDHLDIDYNPSEYTPDNTVAEATDVDHLTAHLAGINNALQAMSGKVNPLGLAQGIKMTAADSGSNGIAVADHNDIKVGLDDFTLVVLASMEDWTPSAPSVLLTKLVGGVGYGISLNTGGPIRCYVAPAASVYYTSTVNPALVDGTTHLICVSVVRESAAADGSVTFYVDGTQCGAAVAIPAANALTLNNVASLYVLGTSAKRTEGICHFAAIFNRALTSAQSLLLYRKGIDFADKWGAAVELMPNQVDRDFSGASAWANVNLNAYDETGDLTITATAADQYCTCPVASAPTAIGKRYRMTFDVANIISTWTIKSFDGTKTIGTVSANGQRQKLEWIATTTGGYRIVAVAANSSADFDNFTLTEIGVLVAPEPEGMQPSPGQWLDSSSNKRHAMQPATGSSLVRRLKTFEVRWTNTWAGTHEAQYIGGVNQAVLPVGCYITDIIGVVSGATIEDIIIGDGADTDRWVEATVGLVAGTVAFTLANRISDGTNYKLVVDPDANFTGSIAFIVRGIILQ